MNLKTLCHLSWITFSIASAATAETDEERVAKGIYPPKAEITAAEKLAAKMPKSVSGTVFLDRNDNNAPDDGEALPGVRVTDGVGFAVTGKDGRYSIDIRPDPLVPHLPNRTIGVCWPSGTWPKRGKSGRFDWWVRLADVKDPTRVDFALTEREQKPQVVVSFGTDPHDNFTRPHNFTWMDETAQAGKHVTFAVSGGDLGYMNFGNALAAYATIQKFTHDFPVLMPHCVGNHDVVGIHDTTWIVPHELAGYGAFIKHVGPVRWSFDVAGIHFTGLDWSLIDAEGKLQCGIENCALDWLEKDLASQPAGTPVYFFCHQPWSPHQRFFDLMERHKVKLAIGGHSHRNMFLNSSPATADQTEYWTKMSLYTLIHARKDGFDVVDRCVYKGNRKGWDDPWDHETRGCALVNDFADGMSKEPKGLHIGLQDLKLDDKSQALETIPGKTYDIRIGARGTGESPASRWGLRLTGEDGARHEFLYDEKSDMLTLMGLETHFHPVIPTRSEDLSKVLPVKPTTADDPDHWVEMRIMVTPDRVRVLVGNRLHYEKFVKPGAASKIEVFSENGATEFKRIDLWQRTYPADYQPRRTANSG